MLRSLTKLLLFVLVVGLLPWGGAWLMEQGGGAVLTVGATEVSLTPLQLALAVLMLGVAVWLLLKLLGVLGAVLRFLNGDNTAISRHFSRRRQRKGLEELTEAAVALAAGDG